MIPQARVRVPALGAMLLPALSGALALDALAQPDSSGIEFVTVGDPGNPAWTGDGSNNNRGRVDYEFRIGKFEVTTAQWAAFMNAAFDRPDLIPHVNQPFIWGAVPTTPTTPGGQRWAVPAGNEMLPVGGIDWRTAAIFCNWHHNGRTGERAGFLDGAYSVSTFGYIGGGLFTDQITHHPGARFWVPSLDEWVKSAHWSPDRYGPGQGGWWTYSNSSDTPFVYAPPPSMGGNGTANSVWSEFTHPGLNPYRVPLGAYTGVTSPWGLFDCAGATGEWTEGYFRIPDEPLPRDRFFEGSYWEQLTSGSPDTVGLAGGGELPSFPSLRFGLRVATVVPAPGAVVFILGLSLSSLARRRRAGLPS